ncbi:hypothetical protein ACFVFJ_47645 [Streptomyces sp. NPDC057717]|uniref:hypothetical protein n=1 Tax=Streptomyces sp. NPDC057717 TaxID=3346224 RepID=UPI0036BA3A80
MNFLQIVGALLIVVLVIARQLRGEPLRGRRLIVLPVALTILGVYLLAKHDERPTAIDVVFVGIGAVVAALIGLFQGASTVLESRGGVLWARTPASSLWLWLVLIVSRIAITGVAVAMHAHVAGSASPILFTLGLNRLGQAFVVAPRALKSGVPMAPERDGQPFIGRLSDAPEDHTRPGTGGNLTPDRYASAIDVGMQAAPLRDARLRRERRRERRSNRRGGH